MEKKVRDYKDAQMRGKVVLLRVDHNVVKKGKVIDPYRIEATIPTILNIALRGGLPILMTHVGRPKDKKSGKIFMKAEESVTPVAEYLQRRLDIRIGSPEYPSDEGGIGVLGQAALEAVADLKAGKWDMLYLPNIRWFEGEEAKDEKKDSFAKELAALGDLFVNDAFGSWQAHVSTYHVARLLPSYAGSLMMKEVLNLKRLMEPKRPFLAIIAGSKYDTKIGPLNALYEKADKLILGGVMYNAYLAAKYDLEIQGVLEEDKELAKTLVERDKKEGKLVELNNLVESPLEDPKEANKARVVDLEEMKGQKSLGAITDLNPSSYEDSKVKDAILSAKTIFVNAVMGWTPYYNEGSKALFHLLFKNKDAEKFLAGGDTLQEFRRLCPGEYLEAQDDPKVYFFTGGGAVLTAIEQGTPFGLKPLEPLLEL